MILTLDLNILPTLRDFIFSILEYQSWIVSCIKLAYIETYFFYHSFSYYFTSIEMSGITYVWWTIILRCFCWGMLALLVKIIFCLNSFVLVNYLKTTFLPLRLHSNFFGSYYQVLLRSKLCIAFLAHCIKYNRLLNFRM